MMKLGFKKCLVLMLICAALMSVTGVAFAAEPTVLTNRDFVAPQSTDARDPKVVTVGWPTQGNLMSVDKNGNPSGYTHEYLMRVKQFTGWDYKFVVIDGTNNELLINLYKQLMEGAIDLMGGLVFDYNKPEGTSGEPRIGVPDTTEVDPDKGVTMSVSPYGTSYNVLTVAEQNTNFLSVTDLIRHPEPVRIAVLRDAAINTAQLEYFFSINKIKYELVLCDNKLGQKEALQANRADLMTDVDILMSPGFRIVAKYKSQMLGFGVNNGQQHILDELNEAMTSIEEATPGFQVELYQKYFESTKNVFVLTAAEREFVERNLQIPVLVNPNMAPFQYLDEKGQPKGITYDVLALVAERSGLKFVYNQADTQDILRKKEGNYLTASLPYRYTLADEFGVQLTSPYATVPMSLIANASSVNKDKAQSVIAVINGEDTTMLSEYKQVKYYNSMRECMDAVESGEVDFTYGNSYSTMFFGFQFSYKKLVSIPIGMNDVSYCIGVSKSADTPLLSIVNKALRSIDAGRISAIISENTKAADTNVTLSGLIQRYPLQTLLVITLVFVLIAGGVLSFLVVKVRANRRLVIDTKRFNQLSDISDEYLFEYDVRSDVLNVSQKYAEVFGLQRELTHCKTHNDCPPFLASALHGNRTSEFELTLADGTKNWFRVFHTPVLNNKKETVSVIGKLVNIQESKAEMSQLFEKSVKDDLTKLYKIGHFWNFVNQKLNEQPRKVGQFLIFDLDGFKGVNDTYGHLEGDRVLKEVAKILTEVFRAEDMPARLGGDEFVAYMNGATKAVALRRAEEVLKRVESSELSQRISLSCGICETIVSTDYEDVYRTADQALYLAKSKGGNCVEVTNTNSKSDKVI